jgi:2-dehydro-3-deoxyglucarate aldolase/4-hydroxy-2-oxoheptanedioate aldolase
LSRRKSLRELLDGNTVPIGMQCFTGNHTLIEVLGATGFDYVWLDSEHSAINPRALEDTMRTCEVAGLIPLVRIPEPTDGTAARRALEAGAEGIIVPMVRSAADVHGIIEALTFPPTGKRGLCPGLRVPGYTLTGFPDYLRESDAGLLVIPMIETVEALEHIDEICAIEQVGLIVFASGELSFAMGEGTASESSPKIREARQKVQAAAARHDVGLIGGPMLNPTEQACAEALDDGISVLCLGLDALTFRQVCERTVAAANAAVATKPGLHRPPAPPSGFPASY